MIEFRHFFRIFLSVSLMVMVFSLRAMMQFPDPSQGVFDEQDKREIPIKLKWVKYSKTTKEIIDLQKSVTPILAEAITEQELKFVKAFQALSDEEKKAMDPSEREEFELFAQVKTPEDFQEVFIRDRNESLTQAEAKLSEQKKQSVAPLKENYLIIAKDFDGTILGFVEFNIKPDYLAGSIELEPLMVSPKAQGRGLANLLIFSILKLNKKIKRIFLGTKKENVKARAVYEHLGFKQYEEIGDGVRYEYLIPKKEQICACDCVIL